MNRNYVPFTPKVYGQALLIDNFQISQSYDLGENKVISFGTQTAPYKGVGLLVYDTKLNQILFQDTSNSDEDFIKPHFFKTTSSSDPIVILCATGADYTYGVSVYSFHKNITKNIGYMNIALSDSNNASSTDPAPWALINISEAVMNFSFSKPVATDFQGQKQKNYNAGELMYQYKGGKLTMQTK